MAFNITNTDIANLELSNLGIGRINWAANDMPVLNSIQKRFYEEKPLNGINIAYAFISLQKLRIYSRATGA
tara:strand:+ start:143 stop:355 length:213 start_codon:yes stop_codon:yes gene_type:complete